jgi:hypothetical protein
LGSIEIFALPTHLRAASERMARIIRSAEFDALFMFLPQDLNDSVRSLAEGCPYEYFLERVRELSLIPEPIGRWEYEMEPILLAIRGISNRRPGLEIWCYRQSGFVQLSAHLATNVAKLVLRASITERARVDDWRALITEFLEASADVLDEETEYVAERSKGRGNHICIRGMDGRIFRDRLSEHKLKANLVYVLLPYYFTPIEILTREMKRELKGSPKSRNRNLQIIEHHIDFVRQYVLTSRNYDEAYFKWVTDMAPCTRSKGYPLNTLENRIRP